MNVREFVKTMSYQGFLTELVDTEMKDESHLEDCGTLENFLEYYGTIEDFYLSNVYGDDYHLYVKGRLRDINIEFDIYNEEDEDEIECIKDEVKTSIYSILENK